MNDPYQPGTSLTTTDIYGRAMGILDSLKTSIIINRKNEETLYAVVAKEMAAGVRNEALWLKALQLAAGDKERQVAKYIGLRVESLKDDAHIMRSFEEELPRIEVAPITPKQIEKPPCTETLVSMIDNSKARSVIEEYFSGLTSNELKKLVNQRVNDQYALITAIRRNRPDIVEWLLISGANPRVKASWGDTPMHEAIAINNKQVISILEKHLNEISDWHQII